MLGGVALLIAVDEVEQPHVAIAVLTLTGLMLVGWMAEALVPTHRANSLTLLVAGLTH